MPSMNVSEARSKLYNLIEETKVSHCPIRIVGKRSSAVLVSEEDWEAIQETMYLLSIPGMRESILEGLNTPVSECLTELNV